MSNIFDALQRAESESSGTESPRFSLATELLQAAERKMREAGAGQPQARVESSAPISAAELLHAAEQKMREADAAPPLASVESPISLPGWNQSRQPRHLLRSAIWNGVPCCRSPSPRTLV